MLNSNTFSSLRSPSSENRSSVLDLSPISSHLSSRPASSSSSLDSNHISVLEQDSELLEISSQFPQTLNLNPTHNSSTHLQNLNNMDYTSELEELTEEDQSFLNSEFQSDTNHHPSTSSSTYLQFESHDQRVAETETDHHDEFFDQDQVSYHPTTDELDPTENQMDEDHDSLMDASDSEVERQALAILGIDRDGRVLSPAHEDELLLQSLWTNAGTCDLPQGLTSSNNNKPIDPNSPHAPPWFRKLQSDVLIRPPSNPEDAAILVNSIKKNLLAIVNNLSEDQWKYPVPPAFLPSTSLPSSSRANSEMFKTSHEDYLQTDFNPLSQASLVPSGPLQTSPQLPRQLWLGEDEDDGVDSDASLMDLLSENGSHGDQSHLSPGLGWCFVGTPRRSNNRHGQASSLAKQVSRLGMAE